MLNKRCIRDLWHLTWAVFFFWIFLPHITVYLLNLNKCREYLNEDMIRIKKRINVRLSNFVALIYLLFNNSYFRSLYYYRIGPVMALLIGWWGPADKTFIISNTTKIGRNFAFAHPYSTVINAESIGDNFSCLQCTTVGSTAKGRPVIGDNVDLGANVVVIGSVRIGNNVSIGAGSVVVKDIPDNSVAVGNPARVVKKLDKC